MHEEDEKKQTEKLLLSVRLAGGEKVLHPAAEKEKPTETRGSVSLISNSPECAPHCTSLSCDCACFDAGKGGHLLEDRRNLSRLLGQLEDVAGDKREHSRRQQLAQLLQIQVAGCDVQDPVERR